MKSGRLTGIEAGRGVAALLVLGVHTRDHLFKNFHVPVPLGDLFIFGHAGVDFFFVLSGFIILYVHSNDIGRPERLGHYLQRRFTRIYPFYWIATLLTLLTLVMSAHAAFPSLSRIAASASLLPVSSAPLVPVAWTLQNEITFYAVFSFLVWNRRLGTALLAVWGGLLVWNLATWTVTGPVLDRFNLEFFFGMAAAWILRHRTVPLPWLMLGAGVVIFFATGYADDINLVLGYSNIAHLGYALGALLAILGLVETERQGRLHVPRVMFELGGASYAIYLTHLLIIGAVWQVMEHLGLSATLPLWVQFLMLVTGGAVGGWALSRLVEQPVLSFTRRLFGRWAARSQPVRTAGGALH